MYLGKRKYFDPDQMEKDRAEVIKTKRGAVWNAFLELEGLINQSELSTQYFERSRSWFSQKLNGCTVYDKKKSFTLEEYHQLAEAFRDIAKRLNAHADEIDAATPYSNEE